MTKDWTAADRLSDRIVDVVNEELDAMRATDTVDALQLFAGQCLALLATLKTAPRPMPPGLEAVAHTVAAALAEMFERHT